MNYITDNSLQCTLSSLSPQQIFCCFFWIFWGTIKGRSEKNREFYGILLDDRINHKCVQFTASQLWSCTHLMIPHVTSHTMQLVVSCSWLYHAALQMRPYLAKWVPFTGHWLFWISYSIFYIVLLLFHNFLYNGFVFLLMTKISNHIYYSTTGNVQNYLKLLAILAKLALVLTQNILFTRLNFNDHEVRK